MSTDILDSIRALGWAYKVKHREAWIAPCPFCDDGAANPERQMRACRGFAVNLDHGGFHCFACGESGSVLKIAGVKRPPDDRGQTSDRYEPRPAKPVGEIPPLRFYRSQWNRHPAGVEYAKARGFNRESILAWGLGWDGARDALAIPTIDSKGTVRCWKFRMRNPGSGPKYNRTAGAPSLLHGVNLLPPSPPFPPVTVTEGELDAIALWQYGIRPVVSIPSGATARWQPSWVKALEPFGQVFLAYDDDDKGNEGVQVAVEALGVSRCKRVALPRKDASQCLEDGITKAEIRQAFDEARPAWVPEHIIGSEEIHASAIEWLTREETLTKVSTGIHELDHAIGGGLAPGELTLIYGATAHGKSTLALSILVNALMNGTKCLSASFEYIEAHHWRLIAGQRIDKRGFSVTADDLRQADWLPGVLGLSVMRSTVDYSEDDIAETLRWASAEGIRLAVFDPLDHLVPDDAQTRDYYGDVARTVRRLRDVIVPLDLHVIVVCPVSKTGDLAGRNTLKHDAWNLIHIERDTDEDDPSKRTRSVTVTVEKARRTGVIGRNLDLLYLMQSARIVQPEDVSFSAPF